MICSYEILQEKIIMVSLLLDCSEWDIKVADTVSRPFLSENLGKFVVSFPAAWDICRKLCKETSVGEPYLQFQRNQHWKTLWWAIKSEYL